MDIGPRRRRSARARRRYAQRPDAVGETAGELRRRLTAAAEIQEHRAHLLGALPWLLLLLCPALHFFTHRGEGHGGGDHMEHGAAGPSGHGAGGAS